MNAEVLARITRERVIFILRATTAVDLDGWVEAAVAAGAGCLEITLPTPGALPAIARARRNYPNLLVGGGTVRSADEVAALAAEGAAFAISPHFDPGLIEACAARRLAAIPGVQTPTEMMAAWRAGATALKLFPAPPALIVRALRAPLPDLPLVAVGGISSDNLATYLAAGCVAVGVGGSIFAETLQTGEIRRRIAAVLQAARAAVA